MKVTTELEREDLNKIHDIILEALGFKPSDEEIIDVFNKLPKQIKGLASQWGTDDTVFCDNMFVWLHENKEEILKLWKNK